MKIEESKLFVVNVDGEETAHNTEKEAIQEASSSIDDDMEEDDVEVIEVDISGEEWTIKQMSWAKIAIEMMKQKNSLETGEDDIELDA